MPQRFLKPGFRTSQRLSRCPMQARLMFANLISLVDDWGRYEGDLSLLRRECFPLDDVRQKDFDEWIQALEDNDILVRYQVDAAWYVEVRRWTERKRSKSSKFPALPKSDNKCCARRSTNGSGPNGDDEGADDGAGEDGSQDFGWLTAPEELTEYSPKVATLMRFGMQPHRQGGWMAQKVGDFIDANGGEAEALRRLNSAADAGCKTWDEATAWCRRQSWNAADEKAKVTNANSGQAIHGRRIKPT